MKKLSWTICTVISLPTGLLQKINRVSGQVIPLQTSYYILLVKSIRLLIVQNVWKFVQYFLTFPKVWHEGLIFKLKQNGISGNLLKLFQNYLSNRKQCVVLSGAYSDYSGIESGVPPGYVLGPIFLIYINDLERNINSNIQFFADDTMLFSLVNSVVNFCTWLELGPWNHTSLGRSVGFNPDPTKQAVEILFSCKKSTPTIHSYYLMELLWQKWMDKSIKVLYSIQASLLVNISISIMNAKKNLGIIKYHLRHLIKCIKLLSAPILITVM